MEESQMAQETFEILPFEDQITYVYARIRSDLENSGKIIGPNDMIIASIVKFHEGIIITNNEKEFENVEGLKVENWIQ
jgi:tRNA(fMet)-specific endonuclease VapC